MGYHARVRRSELRVRVEDYEQVARAGSGPSFLSKTKKILTFDEALDYIGWQPVDPGQQSGWVEVERHCEKYREEEFLFWQTVAPVVEGGSFVEFEGEDGQLWRWDFRRGELNESEGHIAWVPTTRSN